MFKIKLLLTAGFFINLFFSFWLIRLYSTLSNFTYESVALQRALLYNYDQLYLNYRKMEINLSKGNRPIELKDSIEYLQHNLIPIRNWVFDQRLLYENEKYEYVHVLDWFKRFDNLPGAVEAQNFSILTDRFYWILDKICNFFSYFLDFDLSPDSFLWILLAFMAVLLVISYFADPWTKRLDAIERRLYLHERFLEDKLHNGSPLEMKDTWFAKDEAFYTVRDMWKERAYYNINQNVRSDEYREPQPGQY
jgi:hypothetical protein